MGGAAGVLGCLFLHLSISVCLSGVIYLSCLCLFLHLCISLVSSFLASVLFQKFFLVSCFRVFFDQYIFLSYFYCPSFFLAFCLS